MAFYARRVRRLMPAAAVVVVATIAVASTVYSPLELKEFSSSAFATALYASNFWFAHISTDYLAADTGSQSPAPYLVARGGRAVLPGLAVPAVSRRARRSRTERPQKRRHRNGRRFRRLAGRLHRHYLRSPTLGILFLASESLGVRPWRDTCTVGIFEQNFRHADTAHAGMGRVPAGHIWRVFLFPRHGFPRIQRDIAGHRHLPDHTGRRSPAR